MAKLSARGRYALVSVWKIQTDKDATDTSFYDNKIEKRLMSDGHILVRHTARWKEHTPGQIYDWGWKDKFKVSKETWTNAELKSKFIEDWKKLHLDKGFTLS